MEPQERRLKFDVDIAQRWRVHNLHLGGRGGGFENFANYKTEYKRVALQNVVALLTLLMLG